MKKVTTQAGVFLGTRAGLGALSPSSAGENKRAQRVAFCPFCCPRLSSY